MARKALIEKNNKRKKTVARYAAKRKELKAIVSSQHSTPEEKLQAQLKLGKMPRDAAAGRVRNRCMVTGRPRAYYRKFGISRIALRELAHSGELPGVTKSSW